MNLSPLQARGADAIRAWLADPSAPQVFYLAGYAGAGKSTLIKHLVSDVRGRICYGAFTGKAALVMRSKGCPTAQTIHSLIYRYAGERPSREAILARLEEARAALAANMSRGSWRDMLVANIKRLETELAEASDPKRGQGPKFRLNPASDAAFAALIVIDEVSMIDSFLGKDLESFGTKILAIGDPAQLPPIYGAGYFTSREPDFLLDEVHRQAEDSPVLWAATKIRRGEDVPYGVHGGALVVASRGDADNEARALAADQIIVGRNRTRRMTNRKVRDLRGFAAQSPWPMTGDRLVCLRNDREAGLLNGSLWDVKSCKPEEETMEMQIEIADPDQTGNEIDCRAWMHHVAGRDQELQGNFARCDLEEFDYGYALTGHKAQGSAWNAVYVLDESAAFGKDARSWLYTAVTRAARSLTLVR